MPRRNRSDDDDYLFDDDYGRDHETDFDENDDSSSDDAYPVEESLDIALPSATGFWARFQGKPHPGFWFSVLWLIWLFLLLSIGPSSISMILYLLWKGPGVNLNDTKGMLADPVYHEAMLPATAIGQITSLASILFFLRIVVGKDWARLIALRRPSGAHVMLVLVGLPAFMVLMAGTDRLVKEYLPTMSNLNLDEILAIFGTWPLPAGVLVIGIGPGITEELWFRGFLGRGLLSRYGAIGGILITSLFFGILHLEPRHAVFAFCFGIMLHLVFLATRSLLVPMILHMSNNSISVISMHTQALDVLDPPEMFLPWYVYVASALLLAAIGWTLYQSRARLADEPETDGPTWRPGYCSTEYPPAGTTTRVEHPRPELLNCALTGLAAVAFFAALFAPVNR